MGYVTGVDYKFEIDPTNVGTTYTELNIVTSDEAMNETTDTFYRIVDDGFSTNVVTAIDPQFTITIKADSTDTTLNALLDKKYTLTRGVKCKITDNISAEVVTFGGVITNFGTPRNVGSVTEVSMTIKMTGKPTIA